MASSEGNSLTKNNNERQPLTNNNNKEQKIIAIDCNENTNKNPSTKQCTCCGPDTVVNPYGSFKIIWDLLVSIVIIISAIEIPLTMAFDIPVDFTTSIGRMSFCIDIFLCCDICVTFRTAYYDKYDPLNLIKQPNLIAKQYAKGWFVFDFLTSFPFGFIFTSYDDDVEDGTVAFKFLRIIRIVRILRVFRIYKMMGIMREMNRLFPTLKKWLGISQVLIFMLFVAHYFACLWFGVGKNGQKADYESWLDFEEPPIYVDGEYNIISAYTTCMYWSVVTLFTTGYGDIVAHNTNEKWVAMFVIVIGCILTAYLVGTLTLLVFEGDKQYQYTQEKMDEAYSFGAYFGLSNVLVRAITAHIQYHCEQNFVASDPNEFVKSLPQHLRTKVETEIAQRSVGQVDLFKQLGDSIMGNIAIRMEAVGCNAGCHLFVEGEHSSEIYVLRVGCARLIFGETDVNAKEGSRLLKRGDIVGEHCMISSVRTSTLICETWCEFWILRREMLKEIICDHLKEEDANNAWEEMKKIVEKSPMKQRRVSHMESGRLIKARAKDKIKDDKIYEELFAVENVKSKLNLDGGISLSEKHKQQDSSSGIVDKLRMWSRLDSGLKDYKMRKHYKMLKEKGVDPIKQVIDVERKLLLDRLKEDDDDNDNGNVELMVVNKDIGRVNDINISEDDEKEEQHSVNNEF
eukprot:506444_1